MICAEFRILPFLHFALVVAKNENCKLILQEFVFLEIRERGR
jgi:hypothetical protein